MLSVAAKQTGATNDSSREGHTCMEHSAPTLVRVDIGAGGGREGVGAAEIMPSISTSPVRNMHPCQNGQLGREGWPSGHCCRTSRRYQIALQLAWFPRQALVRTLVKRRGCDVVAR